MASKVLRKSRYLETYRCGRRKIEQFVKKSWGCRGLALGKNVSVADVYQDVAGILNAIEREKGGEGDATKIRSNGKNVGNCL